MQKSEIQNILLFDNNVCDVTLDLEESQVGRRPSEFVPKGKWLPLVMSDHHRLMISSSYITLDHTLRLSQINDLLLLRSFILSCIYVTLSEISVLIILFMKWYLLFWGISGSTFVGWMWLLFYNFPWGWSWVLGSIGYTWDILGHLQLYRMNWMKLHIGYTWDILGCAHIWRISTAVLIVKTRAWFSKIST